MHGIALGVVWMRGLLLSGCLSLLASLTWATEPVVRVGVLQYGTAHWELSHLQNQGYDRAQGFQLQLRSLANSAAGRLALMSGDVDWIVSDWLWALQRLQLGDDLVFIPFSSSVGELMVPADSSLQGLEDLRGIRLGVAGGPEGKGWQLLQQAARLQGLDLQRDAQVTFAAPPLLNQELRRGRVDAILTYWTFAAQLHAEGGYRAALAESDLVQSLGLGEALPMLGYIARRSAPGAQLALRQAFAQAVVQTKADLKTATAWSEIRPLLRAASPEIEAALIAGYQKGVPNTHLSGPEIAAIEGFWQALHVSEATSPHSGAQLNPGGVLSLEQIQRLFLWDEDK
ncbi:ABC transporter substrate-binding protein [Nitrincola tapanii]|uniref:ABC transporter substrate-binding protein n=1 Tax=Nitrincola tapanii TaxID=1708751 RepID=A0A5A9W6H2_9GAMM|nr:ABC transporter substrate-binding protein [Nitrincola tapanii]KAA0876400.1 ABC transporter substrate-binding protein [Nitrincola tapanii]